MNQYPTYIPALLLLLACQGASDSDSESTTDAGSVDADAHLEAETGPVDPPPPASENWCDRMLAGPAGTDFGLDLSAAHASVRFFGITIEHTMVDDALTAALSGTDPWSSIALSKYASGLGIACALPATQTGLGPATVELINDVALIRPGTGTISLPASAVAAAIDLRNLPAVDELRAALEYAASLVLVEDVPRPRIQVREHHGLSDEAYGPVYGVANVYDDFLVDIEQPPIPGMAAKSMPVVVITADKLAPEAAEFGATLRYANKAWLVGEDVLTAVAEADWLPVGQHGLLHRNRILKDGLNLPDVIPADRRSLAPLVHMMEVLDGTSPPALLLGGISRPELYPFDDALAIGDDGQTIGHARAALLVVHGAARMFFPYFHTVGDTIDTGLLTELDALESSTETGVAFVRNPVQRLTVHLRDSHAGVWFYHGNAPTPNVGALPVLLDITLEGDVVVRRSELASADPGDVLVAIGGTPVADVLRESETQIAGSTPGAVKRQSLQAATMISDPTTWELRAPDATTKIVSLSIADTVTASEAFNVCSRKAGTLDDLGFPELYYINLAGEAYAGTPTAAQLITAAQGSAGLILDGRGYPGTGETWDLVERILDKPSRVRFNYLYVSALERTTHPTSQAWNPTSAPIFEGRVAVLIGPSTQSQAEHILIPLVNTGRADFVGRRTSGANGNITGVMTPGALGVLFTGMEVLFDDNSTFHGIGIQPSKEVHPSVGELANGIDPELQAAIDLLAGN